MQRLAHYEDMEEQGLLVVLPCKVGDTLFEADGEHGVITHAVTGIHWVANTIAVDDDGQEWADYYDDDDISDAFLTREEAENALKGGADNGDRPN